MDRYCVFQVGHDERGVSSNALKEHALLVAGNVQSGRDDFLKLPHLNNWDSFTWCLYNFLEHQDIQLENFPHQKLVAIHPIFKLFEKFFFVKIRLTAAVAQEIVYFIEQCWAEVVADLFLLGFLEALVALL